MVSAMAVTRGHVQANGGLERSPGGPTPTTRSEFVWGELWPSRGVSMSPSDCSLQGRTSHQLNSRRSTHPSNQAGERREVKAHRIRNTSRGVFRWWVRAQSSGPRTNEMFRVGAREERYLSAMARWASWRGRGRDRIAVVPSFRAVGVCFASAPIRGGWSG